MLRAGIDMIEVERIDDAILRFGSRFFERFFAEHELIDANGRTPALAARFAAKEAVAKALGTGIGEVGWLEIEILTGSRGEPLLLLHGDALRVRVSHEGQFRLGMSSRISLSVPFSIFSLLFDWL